MRSVRTGESTISTKTLASPSSLEEGEILTLKASTELLDGLVNHSIITVSGRKGNAVVRFPTAAHRDLFCIRLVDFLSVPSLGIGAGNLRYLQALMAIAHKPSLGHAAEASDLQDTLAALSGWLDANAEIALWLPTIDVELAVKARREELLWITGNYAKHNFARLTAVTRRWQAVLSRCGHAVTTHDSLNSLHDACNRLQEDFVPYHATTICELLNDVRWALHEYLVPVYEQHYRVAPRGLPEYFFTMPSSLSTPFARTCFWDLMNDVRRKPYVDRFETSPYLKGRY